MKAIVLAYHNIGCAGLEAVLRSGLEVAAVFTHKDDPGENVWFRSVAELAAARGVPVYAPEDINHPLWVEKIKALAPTLLKLQGIGVAHTPPIPQGAKGLGSNFPVVKIKGDALALGWFRDDKRRNYLFVVNRSFKEDKSFSVFLQGNVRKVVEISQEDGQPVEAEFVPDRQELTASLQAGEGRLFRFDGR